MDRGRRRTTTPRPLTVTPTLAGTGNLSRELLEWLATISPRHQEELQRLQDREAAARQQREQLEWLASISEEHAVHLRAIEREEAKLNAPKSLLPGGGRTAEEELLEWDAAKHPRGGFSQNRGWFSLTGSTGAGGGTAITHDDGSFTQIQNYFTRQVTVHGKSSIERKSPDAETTGNRTELAHNPKQSGSAQAREEGSRSNEDELDVNEVREFVKLIYGEKGAKLLKAFEQSGGAIKAENPLWGKSALDGVSWKHLHQIRLRRDMNPAEAAQELMERLIDASGMTVVRQRLDHSGFKNIEELIDSYRQSVKQSAAATAFAAELYLSGISIASEGADWVVTINDLSEGRYEAALAFLPMIPATVGKTRIVLKHGGQTIRIPIQAAGRAVKTLPIDELIALLESTRNLARNMEKAAIRRPVGTAAHHIVPATLKKLPGAEETRDILTKFGIDVSNAANGVYLPSNFDNAVKAAYHGSLHTKRYYAELYSRLRKAQSKEEVLLTLNQIRKDLLAGTFPQ